MPRLAALLALACALIAWAEASAAARPLQRAGIIVCDDRGCGGQADAPAAARRQHRAGGGFVTVTTAAGIAIEVAPVFAAPAKAVITALVAAGYRPKKIHCRNFGHGHVAGSFHFKSQACDVDQCGWGCSPVPRALMQLAVAAAGLRDGCEFRDHGHFDMGPHLDRKRILRNCGRAYAEAIGRALPQRWAGP